MPDGIILKKQRKTREQFKSNAEYKKYLKLSERIAHNNKAWYKINRDRKIEDIKNQYKKYKKIASEKVGKGKIECINCGSNIISTLEINHKVCVGRGRGFGGRKFYATGYGLCHRIALGWEDPNDFDIRCQPCNKLHYIESKLGVPPGIYTIKFNKSKYKETLQKLEAVAQAIED